MTSKHTSIGDGERRTVWIPANMDSLIEDTRKKLGMNRSAFYKYAVVRLLQELSMLTETVHRKVEEIVDA